MACTNMNGLTLRLWLDRSLTVMSAVPLFTLMCIVVIDVVGRYIFNKPLAGGFELTEMLLAITIFASLPLVEMREEQIAIDLLDRWYSEKARRWRRLLTFTFCAVAMSVIARQMFTKGFAVSRDAMTTAVLLIPVAPVAFFIGAMCLITAILLVAKSLQAAFIIASRA